MVGRGCGAGGERAVPGWPSAIEAIDPDLVPVVLEVAAVPVAIGELERVLAAPARIGLVRPVVLHLLWSGLLSADLHRVLDADTLVRSVGSR